MTLITRRLRQDLTTRLYRLATSCGTASIAGIIVALPLCAFCPLSLWRLADKRPAHAFWRASLPQRQFFTPPLSMIHINAP